MQSTQVKSKVKSSERQRPARRGKRRQHSEVAETAELYGVRRSRDTIDRDRRHADAAFARNLALRAQELAATRQQLLEEIPA